MADNKGGTLELIAIQMAKILTVLKEKLDNGNSRTVFAEMGVQFPDDLDNNSGFSSSLATLVSKLSDLPKLTTDLVKAISDKDYSKVASVSITIIISIKDSIDKFSNISGAIDTYANTRPGAEQALFKQFALELPEKLLSYAIISELDEKIPVVSKTFEFFDIITATDKNVGSTDPLKPPYTEKVLNYNKLGDFLTKPNELIKSKYNWGNSSYNEVKMLKAIGNILTSTNIPAVLDEGENPPVLDMILLEILPERISSKPDGLALKLAESFDTTINLSGSGWTLKVESEITAPTNTRLIIEPGGNLTFIPPTVTEVNGELGVELGITNPSGNEPYIIIGKPESNRLEFQKVTIGAGSRFIWDTDDNEAKGAFNFDFGIEKLKIVLTTEGSDGFLAKVLPLNSEAEFDLKMGWDSVTGFYIEGSAAIEISLPLHLKLGPIEIETLTIAFKIKEGQFPLELGADFKFDFGPLKAVVENMGMVATFSFPKPKGNLGPIQLDMGFKPPNGVGLTIDAGVVKGGGYLYFDFDNEEYAGALELTFADFLSLKAIGLITTKMPDGSKGFSLLVIITAEFTIQLGYGFVFLGAGGLLGLHRTMKLEPLAEGVRTGATANIMFPTNIVENAPQIISDLRTFFPVEDGKFLIGPMVKLGWGTPTLISISLGIIIEIRIDNSGGIERIAILGVIKCILPDEDAALLVLQVNFIGAIDFQKKNAFFFASIFESRVLFITIEGDMGLLIAWGDDANFVISVGGFHPRFNPPPLPFPVPKRVSLNILNESWGKIRVEGYFAITTNTVQFGAKIEIYFGISEFKIEGMLSFDALFQFNPFYFIVEIAGKVALKVFGFDMFSISLEFSLEGTSPWRAKGYGKISILFFSFKARFDETWGKSENTTLEPISIIPILVAELENIQNWQAIAPSSNNLFVTLRNLPEPTEDDEGSLALHPIGTIRISQRAMPLIIHLDKIGSQKPKDASKLDFTSSGIFVAVNPIKENFARAQFQNMDNSKKLSSPAFEKDIGGYELSVQDSQTQFGKIAVRHVRYELITIDTAYKQFKVRFYSLMQVMFVHFFTNNAASRSKISYRSKKEYQPFEEKIDVLAGSYTVAFTKDNKPYSAEAANFYSQSSAEEYMNTLISENPMMADYIHTIPFNEVNALV